MSFLSVANILIRIRPEVAMLQSYPLRHWRRSTRKCLSEFNDPKNNSSPQVWTGPWFRPPPSPPTSTPLILCIELGNWDFRENGKLLAFPLDRHFTYVIFRVVHWQFYLQPFCLDAIWIRDGSGTDALLTCGSVWSKASLTKLPICTVLHCVNRVVPSESNYAERGRNKGK